ncbi:ectonucleotide pyrophosphatase/phosphodiesterase [Candidatus Riflebacteria bacterium]
MRFTVRLLLYHILFFSLCFPYAAVAGDGKNRETIPLILLSFDGFRWDYIDRTSTPAMDWLIKRGVRASSLIPSFPSLTFPNHYTIVTGLYPDNHGIIANSMYDPVFRAYYTITYWKTKAEGRWYGGEPIWVTAEKQGVRAACVFWPGSTAEIKGTRPGHWQYYDSELKNNERINRVLNWLKLPVAKRPGLITVYFNDTDDMGHHFGPDSDEILETVRILDELVQLLINGLKKQNILQKVNIILTSDHGMAGVSPKRIIFLEDYINLADVEVTDWSPATGIQPHPGKEEQIYKKLLNAHPHFKVYRKQEIPARLKYGKHRRVPSLIAIADEGWLITNRLYLQLKGDSYRGGRHGYDNSLTSMHGIFIACGPAFKKGLVIKPFKNIQIYNIMAHVLGLKPAPNDGNFQLMKKILSTENQP